VSVTNGYCTRDELKDWMRSTVDTAAENTKRDRAITAASRGIDHHCDRHFFQTAGTRHFDIDDPSQRFAGLTRSFTDYTQLFIGDIVNLNSLQTDDNVDGT